MSVDLTIPCKRSISSNTVKPSLFLRGVGGFYKGSKYLLIKAGANLCSTSLIYLRVIFIFISSFSEKHCRIVSTKGICKRETGRGIFIVALPLIKKEMSDCIPEVLVEFKMSFNIAEQSVLSF